MSGNECARVVIPGPQEPALKASEPGAGPVLVCCYHTIGTLPRQRAGPTASTRGHWRRARRPTRCSASASPATHRHPRPLLLTAGSTSLRGTKVRPRVSKGVTQVVGWAGDSGGKMLPPSVHDQRGGARSGRFFAQPLARAPGGARREGETLTHTRGAGGGLTAPGEQHQTAAGELRRPINPAGRALAACAAGQVPQRPAARGTRRSATGRPYPATERRPTLPLRAGW